MDSTLRLLQRNAYSSDTSVENYRAYIRHLERLLDIPEPGVEVPTNHLHKMLKQASNRQQVEHDERLAITSRVDLLEDKIRELLTAYKLQAFTFSLGRAKSLSDSIGVFNDHLGFAWDGVFIGHLTNPDVKWTVQLHDNSSPGAVYFWQAGPDDSVHIGTRVINKSDPDVYIFLAEYFLYGLNDEQPA